MNTFPTFQISYYASPEKPSLREPPHPITPANPTQSCSKPSHRNAQASRDQLPTLTEEGEVQGEAHQTNVPLKEPVRKRSEEEKLEEVLTYIREMQWSVAEFMECFLDPGRQNRSSRHRAMLSAFLKGVSKDHQPLTIVRMMYENPLGRPSPSHPERVRMFSTQCPSGDLHYARPAISTWALELVCSQMAKESTRLISPQAGLRVRASTKQSMATPCNDPRATGHSETAPQATTGERLEATLGAIGGGTVIPSGLDHMDSETCDMEGETVTDTGLALIIEEGSDDVEWENVDEEVEPSLLAAYNLAQQTASNAQTAETRFPPTRRHRAQNEPLVSWDLIHNFSMSKLMELVSTYAPATYRLFSHFVSPNQTKNQRASSGKSQYRPKHIVVTSAICELTYARNQWANLLQITRSIALFSMKAHHSIYRTGSRFGFCLPYSTTRAALETMGKAARAQLRAARRAEGGDMPKPLHIVFDNIQVYARRYESRMDVENEFVHGTSGTAVVMEDCPSGSLKLSDYLAKRLEGAEKRRQLTSKDIERDIDHTHLTDVATLHWLDVLVSYVPTLACYCSDVSKKFSTEVVKHQINPARKTQLHPLGTNDANETTTKGVRVTLEDMFEQVGITKDTLGDQLQTISGDGKSFEGSGRVRKYLSWLEPDLDSMRFIYETAELWHTKYTDLARNCNGKWGSEVESEVDPSCLGYIAKTASSPKSPDLKKPVFFLNARLLELATRAHILHCWETYLELNSTSLDDEVLAHYFETLAAEGKLPTLEELQTQARTLHLRYSTTRAHKRALLDPKYSRGHLHAVPVVEKLCSPELEGVPSVNTIPEPLVNVSDTIHTPSQMPPPILQGLSTTTALDGISIPRMKEKTAASSWVDETLSVPFGGDWPLANSILMMRDGIWFMEVCHAIANSDIGQVLEVFKVWMFTFAGSGHSNYAQYLLEMYCKLGFDTPEPTHIAVLNNYLMNLRGKPGHFHELDLLQEHFNRWLKEHAQHKGKPFSDPWYRNVLAVNVFHCLRLLEEMEAGTDLIPHGKIHLAPHQEKELREILRRFREADLHRHHVGRDLGHHSSDDFTAGTAILRQEGQISVYMSNSLQDLDNVTKMEPIDHSHVANATTFITPSFEYGADGLPM